MVENPDRIDKVERSADRIPRERRMVDIALDHVRVWHLPHVGICSFDCLAEVHGNNLPRSIGSGVEGVPAVATTGVEHDFVAEEFGLDWMDPIKKLRFVLIVEFDKLLPLPPESSGRPFSHRRQARWKQSGYATTHWESRLT